MKNLYLLLLFPAFFAGAQGQAWQTNFNISVKALAPLPDGHWLVGGGVGSDDGLLTKAYIAETSSDGALLRYREYQLTERSAVTLIHPLADGRRLIGGAAGDCDAPGTGYLQLQDKAGNPIWSIVDNSGLFVPEIPALVVTDQLEIITVERSFVRKYELETGKLLEQAGVTDEFFAGIVPLYNTNSFVVAGAADIYLVDNELEINKIEGLLPPPGYYTRLIAGTGNRYFLLRNDFKIDLLDLTGINPTLKTADPGFKILDIRSAAGGLVFCGYDDGFTRVITLNYEMEVQSDFVLSNPDFIAHKIWPSADGPLLLAGVELHGPSPRSWQSGWCYDSGSQHFWMQFVSGDGKLLSSGTDAALTEMIIHQPPQAYAGNDPYFPWSIEGGTFSVHLKNAGTKTLNSVDIVAGHYGLDVASKYCRTQDFTIKQFTDLQLPPGAETILDIGAVEANYVSNASPWQLCFWANVPNGTTDDNHENDFVCHDFHLTTSSHEPGISELTLFPSPAQDALYLQTNGESPGLCRIFNAAGQLATEQTPVSEPEGYALDVSRLPAGFYWLQSERGQGRFVKM